MDFNSYNWTHDGRLDVARAKESIIAVEKSLMRFSAFVAFEIFEVAIHGQVASGEAFVAVSATLQHIHAEGDVGC